MREQHRLLNHNFNPLIQAAWAQYVALAARTATEDGFAEWLYTNWQWYLALASSMQVTLLQGDEIPPGGLPLPPVQAYLPSPWAPATQQGIGYELQAPVESAQPVQTGWGNGPIRHTEPRPDRRTGPMVIGPLAPVQQPIEWGQQGQPLSQHRAAPAPQHKPWIAKAPKWGAASSIQSIMSSEWASIIAYVYDIGTNILGMVQIATWGREYDILQALAIVVGSIVIGFSQVLGARALGEWLEIRATKSDDNIVRAQSGNNGATALVVAIAMYVLWAVDFGLSVVPWVVIFGPESPLGWIFGFALSLLVEYTEMQSNKRLFSAFREPKGKK